MKSKSVKKKGLKRKLGKIAGNEDGDAGEEMSRLQRKQTKHIHFLTKLEEGQRALSASKTLKKKKRKRTREKATRVLDCLSSLADSLPSPEEMKPSTQTFHNGLLQKKFRQQDVVKETQQLAAVLAHPEFQTNPFLAIHEHLTNTLPAVELSIQKKEKPKKGTKKKTKLQKKKLSVQNMDE